MVVVSADGKSYTWGTYSATDPVAESVTLTANPTSITEGGGHQLSQLHLKIRILLVM